MILRLPRRHLRMRGRGRLGDAYYARDDPRGPPDWRNIRQTYGDWEITAIKIVRTPVVGIVQKITNWMTRGELDKRLKEINASSLFHLFMILTITNPEDKQETKQVLLEMNARPYATLHFSRDLSDSRDIPSRDGLTLGEFMDAGRMSIGSSFQKYSSADSNCQHFTARMLRANGVLPPDLVRDFIAQDVQDVLKANPNVARVMNLVTDTAKRADILTTGKGMRNS